MPVRVLRIVCTKISNNMEVHFLNGRGKDLIRKMQSLLLNIWRINCSLLLYQIWGSLLTYNQLVVILEDFDRV